MSDGYFTAVPPKQGLLFNREGIRIDTPTDTAFRLEIGKRQRLAVNSMPDSALLFSTLEGKAHGKSLDVIASETQRNVNQLKNELKPTGAYKFWPIGAIGKKTLPLAAHGRTSYLVYSALLQQRIAPPTVEFSDETVAKILTTKRITTLGCIALGFSNEEIARGYNVSTDTIKVQARNLFQLIEAENRAHAIGLAFGSGLLRSIEPPEIQTPLAIQD